MYAMLRVAFARNQSKCISNWILAFCASVSVCVFAFIRYIFRKWFGFVLLMYVQCINLELYMISTERERLGARALNGQTCG